MTCPSCGFQNEDGALFCDHCKSDLDMPPVQPPIRPTPMNTEDTADQNPVPITLSEVPTGPATETVPTVTPEAPALSRYEWEVAQAMRTELLEILNTK